MYSKMTNDKNEIELPPNYGGSVFGRRESAPRFIPPQGMTARRPTREYAPPAVLSEHHKAPEYEDLKSGEKPVQEVKYDIPCCEATSQEHNGQYNNECDSDCEKCPHKPESEKRKNEKKAPLFPSLSSIGTEELLLIAIALMVFQGGKEPDLALILLALLFIN